VNGHNIYLDEVEAARSQLPQQSRSYPIGVIYNHLVNSLVTTRLMAEEARKLGLDSDEGVKKRVAHLESQVLQQELLRRRMESHTTDEKLREAYKALVAQNPQKEEVHARHVLVESEEQANAVIKRLQKGEDFAKLARELSTGPSGKSGGDLGYFTAERMVPAFSQAAFSIRPGTFTTKPVKTQFGWHVIKTEDKRVKPAPTFEASEVQLRQNVSQKIVQAYTAELKSKAKVETFSPPGLTGPAPPKGK
jgi:peptidyl-prolyl cis-trans isomerase C